MKTIQGFVLIDVDVAALNNAGRDTTTNLENAVMTKKIFKNGKQYPYVSGQAWRYWWRETLRINHGWELSPVTREPKTAFTEADPFQYPDDDMFGYMRAASIEEINPKTGKTKKVNITLTRISPLKNSAFIAVAYNPIVQLMSTMARQEGDAMPYGKDEYCAVMKGMFSIDLDQVGTFSMYARTGFQNINEKMKEEALKNGANEIEDPMIKDAKGNPLKLVRINDSERLKRVKDTVSALKHLAGGAKQTTNMADVTPKLVVLAQFKSGNHPFSHLAKEELGKPVFSVAALKEVLEDYREQFIGNVYIGRRKGFMDELDEELRSLQDDGGLTPGVTYGSVNQIIDQFVQTITL